MSKRAKTRVPKARVSQEFRALLRWFEPPPEPQPGDYLAVEENWDAQTLSDFLQDEDRLHVGGEPDRSVVYLLPIGCHADALRPVGTLMARFYPQLRFRVVEQGWRLDTDSCVMTTHDGGEYDVECRSCASDDGTGTGDQGEHQQLQLDAVMDALLYYIDNVWTDGFCVLALTTSDLYEDERDAFIAGRAYGASRIGMFSFYRYQCDDSVEFLERCSKLATHELGHVLGLDHCVYFHCLMNGSSNLEEDFAGACTLCPVCLEKLFDFSLLKSRADGLASHYESQGMFSEAVKQLRAMYSL